MNSIFKRTISVFLSMCVLMFSMISFAPMAVVNAATTMDIWVQNSADRTFDSSTKPRYAQKEIELYSAKNEYEAAQILVRSENALTNLKLTASVLTGEGGNTIPIDSIEIFREYSVPAAVTGDVEATPDGSNRYTDALLPNVLLNVEANKTQPYWVRVYVPETQVAGVYTGTITVASDEGIDQVPISVKVYDVTLPKTNESNFKMLNWFGSAGCDFGALQSSVPLQYGVEMYDENWWKVMENFAKDLSIHRNNVEFIDFQALLIPQTTIDQDGTYHFNWDYFDRLVQIFIDAGAMQYIYSPPSYLTEKDGEIYLWVLENVNGKIERVQEKINTDKTNTYMGTLFTALRNHLVEKGWVDRFYISALDEPDTKEKVNGSKWFYSKVKEVFPEAKSAEAHSRFTTGLEDSMTTFCPVLDVYETHQEYYQNLKSQGKELWFYTCIGPQGDYLNRFIPYHLAKTRLIPWYVYKVGASGYLHWGYCWWRDVDTFDSLQTGDEWLVRPDKENYDVFTSIRNEAQLDGIEDFELITQLEKKNPQAAKSVVDNIIKSATAYAKTGTVVNEAHKAILNALANGGASIDKVAVPVFSDDFSSGYDTAWQRQIGKWTVKNGQYYFPGKDNNNEGQTNAKGWKLEDGEITVDINISEVVGDDKSNWCAIVFRKTNQTDTMWDSGYTLLLRKNGSLELMKSSGWVELGKANIGELTGESVQLTISMNGSSIKVYQAGKKEALISAQDSSFTEGYTSLGGYKANVTFDNVRFASGNGLMEAPYDNSLVKDYSYKNSFDSANSAKLADWTPSGEIAVTGGKLVLNGGAAVGLNKRVFGDGAVNFTMQLKGGQTAADAKDYWGGVSICKETTEGNVFLVGGDMLLIRSNGTVDLMNHNGLVATGTTDADLTSEVKVRLEKQGDSLRVLINGVQVITATDAAFKEGFFGFNSDGGSVVFDNLLVCGLGTGDTFETIDDFSGDLGKWTKTQYVDASSVQNGTLYLKGVDEIKNVGISPELVLKDTVFSNAIYSFDVKIDKTDKGEDHWAGAFFNSAGQNGFWKSGGYLLYLVNTGELVLYQYGRGNLASVDTMTDPTEDYVNLKISTVDGHIRVYVNDSAKPVIDIQNDAYASGYFGLMSDFTDASYDNVKYAIPTLLVDDLTTADRWNLLNGSGNSKIEGGLLTLYAAAGAGATPEAVLRHKLIGDGFISFDMQFTGTKANAQGSECWAGCVVRSTNDNQDLWAAKGYLVYCDAAGKVMLIDLNSWQLKEVQTLINPSNGFVNMKVSLSGSTIKVYMNNELVLTQTSDSFSEGSIGLVSNWADVQFKNLMGQGIKDPAEAPEGEPVLNQSYFDTFTDGAYNWRIINKGFGSWKVTDGAYLGVGNSGASPAMAGLKEHVYTDAIISWDMSQLKGTSSGISLRRENWNDDIWASGYYLYYDQIKGNLALFKANVGDVVKVSNVTATNKVVPFKVVMHGNNIKVYVDNVETPVINYTDDASSYMFGYVGLCSYDSTTTFDNVKIEVPDGSPTSGIACVTAKPGVMFDGGGDLKVAVNGIQLANGIKVALFDGETQIGDSAITNGSAIAQKANVMVPANESTEADKIYTVKVSIDNGVTYIDKTAMIKVLKADSVAANQAFLDEFPNQNSLNNWKILRPDNGTWALSNGEYSAVSNSSDYSMAALKGYTYTDATISFDMKQDHGAQDKWAYMAFRRTNRDDTIWGSGYFLFYNQAKGWLKIFKTGVGEFGEVNIGTSDGVYRHFDITMKGNNFKVYVDKAETPAIDYTDEENRYPNGYIGMGVIDYAKATFDNIKVTVSQAVSKAELIALYDSNKDKIQGNYTDASWAAFINALETAKKVIDKVDATQVQVNDVKAALESAITGLENKPEPPKPPVNPNPAPNITPIPGPTPDTTIEAGKAIFNNLKPDIDGRVKAEIKDSMINSLLKDVIAGEDGTKSIKVKVECKDTAKEYAVTIPVGAIAAKEQEVDLVVETNNGSVKLLNATVKDLAIDKNSKVELTISRIDKDNLKNEAKAAVGSRPAVEVKLTQDGKELDTNLKVTLDYKLTASELVDNEHLVVYKINTNGTLTTIPNGKYDKDGKINVEIEKNGVYAVGFVKKNFKDTSSFGWAEKQISVLASKGIIAGTSDTTYSPEKNITRAEFLKLLVNTLNLKADITGNFKDIKEDAYYYNEIAIAKALGITNGAGDNKFNPNAPICRQDMMVLIYKALKIAGKPCKEGSSQDLEKYDDIHKVSSYATDSIASLVQEGIIKGTGSNINPKGNTTRAQAAVVLYKLYNR